MNEIIDELEKDYIYLDNKRKKYELKDFETYKIYTDALNEIWRGLTNKIVKEERGKTKCQK